MEHVPSTVPGKWTIAIPPGGDPVIRNRNDEPIATVHGTQRERLKRALLIAKAPALRDAADACLEAFRLMLQHEDPLVHRTARDFIPVLESALHMTEAV